jgi:glycosyltransferase involved in cell wall biosynthesis
MAAQHADWVVGVSGFTLQRFAEWTSIPQDRTVVLPCCVDFTRCSPGKPSAAILEKYRIGDRIVVLTLGRLATTERYKGFDELLEVLSRVRETEPNVLCVIAGNGDDRSRLEEKARALGVADHVRFTGYVPDEDIVDLYRAAHLFVLAGYGEGFGIVLLEAMACGIPVVASTLDGSFEAIGRGTLGIAVDPRDRDALARAILDGLRHPVGGRPQGLERFSFMAFQDRAHALLRRVLSNGLAEQDRATPMERKVSVKDRASS